MTARSKTNHQRPSATSSSRSSGIRTSKYIPKSLVQHDVYRDRSSDPPNGTEYTTVRGGITSIFPLRMHQCLSRLDADGLSHLCSWQPHGRAFVVHRPREFEAVMGRYFGKMKLCSMQRQLNLYGFNRISTGPDKGAHYHEYFLRHREYLCFRVRRIRLKGTGPRGAANPDQEPNFYKMDPMEPMEPLPSMTMTVPPFCKDDRSREQEQAVAATTKPVLALFRRSRTSPVVANGPVPASAVVVPSAIASHHNFASSFALPGQSQALAAATPLPLIADRTPSFHVERPLPDTSVCANHNPLAPVPRPTKDDADLLIGVSQVCVFSGDKATQQQQAAHTICDLPEEKEHSPKTGGECLFGGDQEQPSNFDRSQYDGCHHPVPLETSDTLGDHQRNAELEQHGRALLNVAASFRAPLLGLSPISAPKSNNKRLTTKLEGGAAAEQPTAVTENNTWMRGEHKSDYEAESVVSTSTLHLLSAAERPPRRAGCRVHSTTSTSISSLKSDLLRSTSSSPPQSVPSSVAERANSRGDIGRTSRLDIPVGSNYDKNATNASGHADEHETDFWEAMEKLMNSTGELGGGKKPKQAPDFPSAAPPPPTPTPIEKIVALMEPEPYKFTAEVETDDRAATPSCFHSSSPELLTMLVRGSSCDKCFAPGGEPGASPSPARSPPPRSKKRGSCMRRSSFSEPALDSYFSPDSRHHRSSSTARSAASGRPRLQRHDSAPARSFAFDAAADKLLPGGRFLSVESSPSFDADASSLRSSFKNMVFETVPSRDETEAGDDKWDTGGSHEWCSLSTETRRNNYIAVPPHHPTADDDGSAALGEKRTLRIAAGSSSSVHAALPPVVGNSKGWKNVAA